MLLLSKRQMSKISRLKIRGLMAENIDTNQVIQKIGTQLQEKAVLVNAMEWLLMDTIISGLQRRPQVESIVTTVLLEEEIHIEANARNANATPKTIEIKFA